MFRQGPLQCSAQQESPRASAVPKQGCIRQLHSQQLLCKGHWGLFTSRLTQAFLQLLALLPSLGAASGLRATRLGPCKGHNIQKQSPCLIILYLVLLQWDGGRASSQGCHCTVLTVLSALPVLLRAITLHNSAMVNETSHQFSIKNR